MSGVVTSAYRVLYGDTDQMGVVYYANYLRFAELGRNEFLRARGMPYRDIEQRFRIHLPVVEAQLHYKQPARYDDLLRIETEVAELKRVSMKLAYRIFRAADEKLLVHGHTVHACITFEGKPVRLPEEVSALLEPA